MTTAQLLRAAVATSPITLLTGPAGCGRTALCSWLHKQHETITTTQTTTTTTTKPTTQHQGSKSATDSILHICGSTLDSTDPNKIARRIILELSTFLVPDGDAKNGRTASTKQQHSHLQSAALTAPDEHLRLQMLEAIESYATTAPANKNLMVILDGIEQLLLVSNNNSKSITGVPGNDALCKETLSSDEAREKVVADAIATSPLMQLLDLLPLSTAAFFPKLRYVFSFRCLEGGNTAAAGDDITAITSRAEREILATFFERVCGEPCLVDPSVFSSSSDKNNSSLSSTPFKKNQKLTSDPHSSSSASRAVLVSHPRELSRDAASKVLASHLQQLGKSWPSTLMASAIASLRAADSCAAVIATSVELPPRTAQAGAIVQALIGDLQSQQFLPSSSLPPLGCSSPLYCAMLISELAATATFETLERDLNRLLSTARTVEDLLALIIGRLCSDFADKRESESESQSVVRKILDALVISSIGLSEQELCLIAEAPSRVVVVVLSSLRSFIIDRAGALRADARLTRAVLQHHNAASRSSVAVTNSATTTTTTTTTTTSFIRSRFVDLLFDWYARDEKNSIGRVCRELPSQLLLLGRYTDLAHFLARPAVLREMFCASKKELFLALWAAVLARNADKSSTNLLSFFPLSSPEWSIDSLHPLRDAEKIEAVILLSRLLRTFEPNDAAASAMLERAIAGITRINSEEENENNNNKTLVAHAAANHCLAQLLQRLAQSQVSAGQVEAGIATAQRALKLLATAGADSRLQPGLLKVVGRGLRALGRIREALECFDRALSVISVANNTNSHVTSIAKKNSISNISSAGKTIGGDAAASSASQAEQMAASPTAAAAAAAAATAVSGVLNTESTSDYFRALDFDVAALLDEKGDLHRKLGDVANALAALLRSLALKRSKLPARHPSIALSLYSLAQVQKLQNHPTASYNTVCEAIDIFSGFYGHKHAKLYPFRLLQAELAIQLDQLAVARQLLADLLESAVQRFGVESLEVAEVLQQLASVHEKGGNVAVAEQLLCREAHAIFVKCLPPEHPKLVSMLVQEANLVRKAGCRFDAALQLAHDALNMSLRILGETHMLTAEARQAVGYVMLKKSSRDDEFVACCDMFDKALQTSILLLGSENVAVASCRVGLGDAQRKTMNQMLSAIDNYSGALRVYESAPGFGPNHLEAIDCLYRLGRCRKKLHQYQKAGACFKEAMERMLSAAVNRTKRKSVLGEPYFSHLPPFHSLASSNIADSHNNKSRLQTKSSISSSVSKSERIFFHTGSSPFLPAGVAAAAAAAVSPLREKESPDAPASSAYSDTAAISDDPTGHPKFAILQQCLADCYRKQMDVDQARVLYEKALATNMRLFGEHHEEIAEDLNGLAMLLLIDGRLEEALELEQKALSMTVKLLGGLNRHARNRTRNLNLILAKMGRELLPPVAGDDAPEAAAVAVGIVPAQLID